MSRSKWGSESVWHRVTVRKLSPVVVIVLGLSVGACGGSSDKSTEKGSTAEVTTTTTAKTATSGGLSDRKFNLVDLRSILIGLPQLADMKQVDEFNQEFSFPRSCETSEGERTYSDEHVSIEYESLDRPDGSDLVVTLDVAQLASPAAVEQFVSDVSSFIDRCHSDGWGGPVNVTPLPITQPSGSSAMIANTFASDKKGIHQGVVLGSGRVVLEVFVHKYDPNANRDVAADPAGVDEITKELFDRYAQVHDSAQVPT
jgi:hypothetical protein